MAKPIKYITINHKQHPIRFGYYAIALFSQATGLTLQQFADLGENMRMDHAMEMIRSGLVDGYRKQHGEAPDITLADVADWMDDNPDLLKDAMEVFAASQIAVQAQAEEAPAGNAESQPS